MGIFYSILTKYGAVMVGYAILGLPVFYLKNYDATSTKEAALVTKDYIKNSHLLINLAKVIILKKKLGYRKNRSFI